ncbi:hypothetical protein [Saccharomonospora viridis]|uniref:Uncharacterized protein n=1 Tax=Saccharomonospora viridis TaxID=1852 RepID=A0A837D8K3_9PSEU|nr:hypothetical protein [Saccharomonospora viridis]KHF43535.1 hypothetical protein MINT15_37370 [Saccharomonospora viridis]
MSSPASAASPGGPVDELDELPSPPTVPCTVVWSQGRPYVLESDSVRPRWMGTDHNGRPQALTGEELRRRGWSYRRSS